MELNQKPFSTCFAKAWLRSRLIDPTLQLVKAQQTKGWSAHLVPWPRDHFLVREGPVFEGPTTVPGLHVKMNSRHNFFDAKAGRGDGGLDDAVLTLLVKMTSRHIFFDAEGRGWGFG